jgi:membrane protein
MRRAIRFLRLLAGSSVRSFLDRSSLDFAASIAYRVLLSLFPLAIVLVGIFGLLARATGIHTDVVEEIVEQVPLTGDGREELRELLLAATSDVSALGLVGIIGVLWAASGVVAATRTAVNLAWGTGARSFVRGKLLDVLVVLGAGLVVLLSLVLSLVFRIAERAAAWVLEAFGPAAAVASALLGVGLPALLGFVVIVFAYRVLPAFEPPFRQVLPAAAVAAAAIAVLQQLFVLYVRHFGRYDVIYGSLGAVIAFLLFVYLAAAVFLFGAHLARCWPEALDRSRAAA